MMSKIGPSGSADELTPPSIPPARNDKPQLGPSLGVRSVSRMLPGKRANGRAPARSVLSPRTRAETP
jgi:hypothetical protein